VCSLLRVDGRRCAGDAQRRAARSLAAWWMVNYCANERKTLTTFLNLIAMQSIIVLFAVSYLTVALQNQDEYSLELSEKAS